jgi:hypothetical protein
VPLPARASVPPHASSSGESLSLPDVGATRATTGTQDATHRHEVHIGPAMRAAPLARARSPLVSRSASPTANVPRAMADSRSDGGSDWRSDSLRREVVAGSAMRAAPASGTTTLPPVARATSSATSVDIQHAEDADVAAPIAWDGSARDGSPNARSDVEAPVVTASQVTTIRASETGRPAVPSASMLVQRRLAAPEVRTATTVTLPTPNVLTVARPRAPLATAVSRADQRGQPFGADKTQGALPRTQIVRTQASAPPLPSAPPLLLPHPAAPVIRRVPATDPSWSEIVWRKSGAPGGGGAVAGTSSSPAGSPSPLGRSDASALSPARPSTIGRANGPGSDGGSTTSTNLAAAGAIGAGRRGADASQLIEQVTRRLLRQVAVERERRGGSRWP